MSAGPVEVCCLGETMLLVAPRDGRALRGGAECLLGTAGAESNVATYLARLGHRVRWVSRLGTDALGTIVLDDVRASGVDTSAVERVGVAPTGVMFKDPGPAGTAVTYYRAGSAASTMDVPFLRAVTDPAPAVLHTTGITPALSPACRELTDALVARPTGALLSFDVNHRPALWAGDAGPVLLGYARAADVVFVGLDEAHRLWGTATADAVAELVTGPTWLVVKDADREAVCFHPGGRAAVPSPPVDVVEPVGAGDAFAAGWLSGLLRGLDEREKLRLGHHLAGTALRSAGDQGTVPTEDELGALLGIPPERWTIRVEPHRPALDGD